MSKPDRFVPVSSEALSAKLFNHPFPSRCKPVVNCALLVAINILSGTNLQTDALVSCGVVPALLKLLQADSDFNVIKNVCFAFSNIAASLSKHIEALMEACVYTKLIQIYDSGCHASIKTEILHVFSNTLCNRHFNDSFPDKLGTSYLHILVDSLSSCDQQVSIALHALICLFKSYKFLPVEGKFCVKPCKCQTNIESETRQLTFQSRILLVTAMLRSQEWQSISLQFSSSIRESKLSKNLKKYRGFLSALSEYFCSCPVHSGLI